MSLRIRNKWKYEGNDRWAWSAFLDDDNTGELKDVEYVEYVLHETFPEPRRIIDDPKNGFMLDTGGWGTFVLKAFAHLKNKKKINLKHEIKLEYEPKKGVSE